jgi:hypothetical protein
MKNTVLIAAFLIGSTGVPQFASAGEAKLAQTKWPECYCTDRYGKRHEIGDIICLTVDNRSYEAKCVMAQNNPFWRDLNRGCLSSSLPSNMSKRANEVAALYQ